MSATGDTPEPDTEEQASLWAARLECAALPEEQQAELEAWLAGEPGRRALLSQYCALSAKVERGALELAAAGSFQARPARSRGWTPLQLGFAGLAAALLALAVVWHPPGPGRPERIAAAAGERRSFTLEDGSHVELNGNTSVLVENGRAERRVHLENGEAFFVVSKDKSRPFIVETPAGSVRVTGTQFNVLTETSSQLDVTVVEGTVQVRPADEKGSEAPNPVILGAGDFLAVEHGGSRLRPLSDRELDDALAWRNGHIVCAGMPLSEVLARVGHYHGVRITATAGVANMRLSAISSLDNLDSFLSDLEQGLTVRVSRQPDGSIIVGLPGER
jgi:transmembrane sensor